ncbi:MAG: NFACT RNA binding domain-containing protein [Balneolaceae bacterium]
MNNYYALIYLTDHVNNKLENARFITGISPHKNVWEGYFEQPGGLKQRVVFSTGPGETALFTDDYRPPKKSNVLRFFETLSGDTVEKVTLADGDRLLSIHFTSSSVLTFQLFGNKANLFLVENGRITDAFKNKRKVAGRSAPEPRTPEKPGKPPNGADAKQLLLHYDQKLPRHLITPVIDQFDLEGANPERVRKIAERLVDAMINRPEFRVLENGGLCLIPEDILPLKTQRIYDNINDAVKYSYYKASHLRRFENRLSRVRPELAKALKKSAKALSQLEDADKALERADKYEEYGHLLMAHAHEERDQSKDILEVSDFYRNNRITGIELKKNMSIADNAEYYYERAARAKRRVQEAKRRRKELEKETGRLESLLDSIENVENLNELQDWEKAHGGELKDLEILPGSSQKVSLPWRKTTVGGYEIWIGKNAKSNDRLTSRAHKEDMWLHARGAGGSHVVIRMENRSGRPPAGVIRRAASYAAWHSKIRGSSLAPVICTKRKYVTKPKGAPAGTVRVQREEVIMAAPAKP